MQTFLPYPDLRRSATSLDSRRLGKQRVEAFQILQCLYGEGSLAWSNHPAVLMWKGCAPFLKEYFNEVSAEWERRGYVHNMGYYRLGRRSPPWWFGVNAFHSAHRAALLWKEATRHEPAWYALLGWREKPRYQYWWPTQHERFS